MVSVILILAPAAWVSMKELKSKFKFLNSQPSIVSDCGSVSKVCECMWNLIIELPVA